MDCRRLTRIALYRLLGGAGGEARLTRGVNNLTAIHGDAESRAKHAAMGFRVGWGKSLDQLVAMVKAEG